MELDLAARRVVMASMLYYGLDAPTMFTDSEFDAATLRLSQNWDQLEPIRQWQLGSAEEIRATGNHVKVTLMAANAVAHWLEANTSITQRVIRTRQWRSPRPNKSPYCRYLLPADFRLVEPSQFVPDI